MGGVLFRVQGAGRRVGGHRQPGTALGSLSAEPEATRFVCERTASFAFSNSFFPASGFSSPGLPLRVQAQLQEGEAEDWGGSHRPAD